MPALLPPESLWRRWLHRGLQTTRTAVRHGLNFILPPSCLYCGVEIVVDALAAPSLCGDCLAGLKPADGPQCQKCAAPVGPYLDTTSGCIHCRQDLFHFDRVIRLGVYRDLLRKAVLQAKSGRGEAMACALADLLYTECWTAETCRWDVIVPVPHDWTRRFVQTHAASETIAERLARHLKSPYERGLLRKVRRTPRQAGSPPTVRRQQQKQAFAASTEVSGMKILLVDDVLTTGATANEAAKALKGCGAAIVTVAVLARGLGANG